MQVARSCGTDCSYRGGYVIAAIFIDAEYQRLGIHYREYRVLRASFWIKMAFIWVELGLAIGFGVTMFNGHPNIAAILEWIISLVYILFVWYGTYCMPERRLPEIIIY